MTRGSMRNIVEYERVILRARRMREIDKSAGEVFVERVRELGLGVR